jgi:hypothetical protein
VTIAFVPAHFLFDDMLLRNGAEYLCLLSVLVALRNLQLNVHDGVSLDFFRDTV